VKSGLSFHPAKQQTRAAVPAGLILQLNSTGLNANNAAACGAAALFASPAISPVRRRPFGKLGLDSCDFFVTFGHFIRIDQSSVQE